MDYKEKYEMALERAKQFHKKELFAECNGRLVEYIFPELQESEDEKIKKALIRFHKSSIDIDGIKGEDIIAWLEKQESVDENEVANRVLNEVANSIMRWLDSNCAEGNMCLSGMECEDIENAVRNANWQKIYGYMKKKLEKQGDTSTKRGRANWR